MTLVILESQIPFLALPRLQSRLTFPLRSCVVAAMGAAAGRIAAVIACAAAVVVGVALTVMTGGLFAAICAGILLGGGLAGLMYTVQNWDNWDCSEFFKQVGFGAALGGLSGGLFHGVAGFAAKFTSFWVKTLVFTVGGAVTGFITNVVNNLLTGQHWAKDWWKALAVGAVSGLVAGLSAGLCDKLVGKMVKAQEVLKKAETSIFGNLAMKQAALHLFVEIGAAVVVDVAGQLITNGEVNRDMAPWLALSTTGWVIHILLPNRVSFR